MKDYTNSLEEHADKLYKMLDKILSDNKKFIKELTNTLGEVACPEIKEVRETNTFDLHSEIGQILADFDQDHNIEKAVNNLFDVIEEDKEELVTIDFNTWRKTHFPNKEEAWYVQNCLGDLYPNSKNHKQAIKAWQETDSEEECEQDNFKTERALAKHAFQNKAEVRVGTAERNFCPHGIEAGCDVCDICNEECEHDCNWKHYIRINEILNKHSKPMDEGGMHYKDAYEDMEKYERELAGKHCKSTPKPSKKCECEEKECEHVVIESLLDIADKHRKALESLANEYHDGGGSEAWLRSEIRDMQTIARKALKDE